MSTGDRRGSVTSHHTTQSHHSTVSQHSGSQSQGNRSVGSGASHGKTVVLQDTGNDTLDRYDLMFTGPDGLHHHRVKTQNNHFPGGYVGEGVRSGEMTSNLGYMFRTPQNIPFPRGKHGRLGEIGGEIELWNIKKGI